MRSIAGPGRDADADAHLGGDDVRQRRLAEAGRAVEQHVVERLAAPWCAASMPMLRLLLTLSWLMYSARRLGRSDVSAWRSPSCGSPSVMRSGVRRGHRGQFT